MRYQYCKNADEIPDSKCMTPMAHMYLDSMLPGVYVTTDLGSLLHSVANGLNIDPVGMASSPAGN